MGEIKFDEFESILTPERKDQLMHIADNTLRQDKRINIKISVHDWDAIQRRAMEEGIHSQGLVASMIPIGNAVLEVPASGFSQAGACKTKVPKLELGKQPRRQ
jgi:predicted DNA binding CopG/RHH family protein